MCERKGLRRDGRKMEGTLKKKEGRLKDREEKRTGFEWGDRL